MKKVLIIFLILLSSCFLETNKKEEKLKEVNKKVEIKDVKKIPISEKQKPNELIFHFDYPIFKNSNIDKTIKSWWEDIIEKSKLEYKKNWNNKNPELFFSFEKYEKNNFISVVYEINKSLYKKVPENFIKVFYINKNWKEIYIKDIFSLGNNKDIFIEKLKNKLEKNFKQQIYLKNLKTNLEKYIWNMQVYFENDKVFFIFKKWEIWPYNNGIIKIDFYFEEIKDFLNLNIFENINEKLLKLKKEIQKLEKQKQKAIIQEDLISLEKQIKEKNELLETKTKEKNEKKATIFEVKQKKNTDKYLNEKEKYIALSFDDGPNKSLTPKLLEILKKYNIKATFCVLWKNVSYFPNILKQEYEEWHEICSHSWSHPKLTKLKYKDLLEQINKTDNEIKKIIWIKPKLFRPPYWAFNKVVKKAIWRTIVLRNVDTIDRKNRDIEKNIKTVEKDLKDWSIILFHDIHKESVDTIEPLILKLKSKWYKFLTITELLKKWQKTDFSKKICRWKYECY